MTVLAATLKIGARDSGCDLADLCSRAFLVDPVGLIVREGANGGCAAVIEGGNSLPSRVWFQDPDSGICAAIEGTLDGQPDKLPRPSVDAPMAGLDLRVTECPAARVVAAYLNGGPLAVTRLQGRFSMVLFDPKRGVLVGLRDPLGTLPLFYTALASGGIAVTSQARQLTGIDNAHEYSREFVADFLTIGKARGSGTPFTRVKAVPPGSVLIATEASVRTEPYWDASKVPTQTGYNLDYYAEGFREVFSRAVDRALAPDGHTWCDLSGGLDSSSVVAVAAELSVGRRCLDQLQTLSVVFPETTDSAESEYITAMVHHTGVANTQVSGDAWHLFRDSSGLIAANRPIPAAWDAPTLEVFSAGLHARISQILIEQEGTVLLKGLGAESVVGSESPPPYHLAGMLRSGAVGSCLREALRWQKVSREPLASLLMLYALKPIFGQFEHTSLSQHGLPNWIAPGFVTCPRDQYQGL